VLLPVVLVKSKVEPGSRLRYCKHLGVCDCVMIMMLQAMGYVHSPCSRHTISARKLIFATYHAKWSLNQLRIHDSDKTGCVLVVELNEYLT
jgi:hypothetical protein